jgi:hypothetical protein
VEEGRIGSPRALLRQEQDPGASQMKIPLPPGDALAAGSFVLAARHRPRKTGGAAILIVCGPPQ